jgi:hypothetical protein
MYIGPCTDKYNKFYSTAPALLLIIFFGIALGRITRPEDWQRLDGAAMWAIGFAFFGFIFEMILPGLFPNQDKYRQNFLYSGIFSEPSNVAYGLFPAIAILLSSQSDKAWRMGLYTLIGLFIVSRSSTLIIITLAWLIYDLYFYGRRRAGIIAALIFTIGMLVISANFVDLIAPTIDRVTGIFLGNSASNFSSQIYLQGVNDAIENFSRTNGLGLGVNMMGCNPLPDSEIRDLVFMGTDLYLNTDDGSFLASKIISEVGILGVIFYSLLIIFWININRRNKINKSTKLIHAVRIQNALIFLFLVTSFVRSNGYFNGGLFLLITAFIALSSWKRKIN